MMHSLEKLVKFGGQILCEFNQHLSPANLLNPRKFSIGTAGVVEACNLQEDSVLKRIRLLYLPDSVGRLLRKSCQLQALHLLLFDGKQLPRVLRPLAWVLVIFVGQLKIFILQVIWHPQEGFQNTLDLVVDNVKGQPWKVNKFEPGPKFNIK